MKLRKSTDIVRMSSSDTRWATSRALGTLNGICFNCSSKSSRSRGLVNRLSPPTRPPPHPTAKATSATSTAKFWLTWPLLYSSAKTFLSVPIFEELLFRVIPIAGSTLLYRRYWAVGTPEETLIVRNK